MERKCEEKLLCNIRDDYTYIRQKLEELRESGQLSAYTENTLIDMTNLVADSLSRNHEDVRKEVAGTMKEGMNCCWMQRVWKSLSGRFHNNDLLLGFFMVY